MRILIIGSKGFIGTRCADYFKEKGHDVYGCDVVTDYSATNYFLVDVVNDDYKDIFEHTVFDVCINCSGAASVPESVQNPRRDFELNTANVFKLLDAIRRFQPNCRFIQLSSAAVYGNPVSLPITEDSPTAPISPYGWHKLYSEQICGEFATIYNLKIAVIRPFSVFGSGLQKQLFWDVFRKMKKGAPFELFGTGEETRDFIHVEDMIRVMDLVIQRGEFSNTIYNAANGVATKISEVITLFSEVSSNKTPFTFGGKVKAGDPLYWRADVSKINALGYKQQVSLESGLKAFSEWANDLG